MNVSNGSDLNTINKVGFYSINNPVNAPSEILDWWVDMIVLNTGGTDTYVMQMLIPHVKNIKPDIYIRVSTNSTWDGWYKFSATSVE